MTVDYDEIDELFDKLANAKDNDEYDEEDIVILKNSNGEELKFIEIAGIAYKSKFYAILKPSFTLEEIKEDEAILFEVISKPDKSSQFNIVEDDDIINAVFNEYYRMLDDANKN